MYKFFALAAAAVLVGIDQAIKLWALENLAPQHQIPVIQDLFYLTYVENRGAAFGIFQNRTGILSVLTSIVLVVALAALLSDRFKGSFLVCTVVLIISGGAGNLFDRIFRGFVVDYLDFSPLFGFPVFNFADCCVVVGTLLLLCYIVRYDYLEKKKHLLSAGEEEA